MFFRLYEKPTLVLCMKGGLGVRADLLTHSPLPSDPRLITTGSQGNGKGGRLIIEA